MKQHPAETEEVVELTPEEMDDLDERAAAIERGEFVTAEVLFDELRAIRERLSERKANAEPSETS